MSWTALAERSGDSAFGRKQRPRIEIDFVTCESGIREVDAGLVGFPIRIALGEKSLAKGEVEIEPRDAAFQSVKIEAAVAAVLKRVREA